MSITFAGSPRTTLGIEVEVWLTDPDSRALANRSVPILEEVGAGHPDGVHPKLKGELFQSMVEVITGVCETVPEARADLAGTIGELTPVADRHGAALMSSGTHPFSHWNTLELNPAERYRRLVADIGWPARRMATAGVHFHVGVPSARHAAALVQPLASALPMFLALSASSPFRHGDDTSMASSRTKIFEGLPTAGLPPRLADWHEFETLMATLVNAGVISTIREIWWDVRPHPDFGTVELRMCDGVTNLDEVAALAALAQCLVADLVRRVDDDEPLDVGSEWLIRENKWLAARHGLDTRFLVDDEGHRLPARDLIAATVDRLAPTAELLGCADDLARVLTVATNGPSYRRQRQWLAAGASHAELVDGLVDEFRTGRPRT